jgi:hypothetical protein
MKLRIVPFGFVVALSLSGFAHAQGVPGGFSQGASVGNQAAGPVGAVVGGAIGGVVGGVVGGVQGVLGVNRPAYAVYSDNPPEPRPHHTRVSSRSTHHSSEHPASSYR